jgi:hypothetical protein
MSLRRVIYVTKIRFAEIRVTEIHLPWVCVVKIWLADILVTEKHFP